MIMGNYNFSTDARMVDLNRVKAVEDVKEKLKEAFGGYTVVMGRSFPVRIGADIFVIHVCSGGELDLDVQAMSVMQLRTSSYYDAHPMSNADAVKHIKTILMEMRLKR